MSGDMDDILLVFFQECEEQLQELERGLSALSDGESGKETINAVFRAVHSVKGGAASFGLENLVRFAHVFESSLDGLRSGRVAPTPEIVKTFLKAMDVLSDLVAEAQGGATVDTARIDESRAELQPLLAKAAALQGRRKKKPSRLILRLFRWILSRSWPILTSAILALRKKLRQKRHRLS